MIPMVFCLIQLRTAGRNGRMWATSTLADVLRCGVVFVFVLLVSIGGEVHTYAESEVDRSYVHCSRDTQEPVTRTAVQGRFEGSENSISRMILSNEDPEHCLIRHERGNQPAEIGDYLDGSHFVSTCRDPVSKRDHVVAHSSAGQYHDIHVWTVDQTTKTPKQLYIEAWADSVYDEYDDPGVYEDIPVYEMDSWWGLGRLVAADGSCLWRTRKKAFETFESAMAELRIGQNIDLPFNGGVVALQPRAIPAETVRKWLVALDGVAMFEGAEYADDAARNSWRVVQVLGGPLCDSSGVVLVLDRQTGAWKAIYDVLSGCSKSWNFPLRGMVVKKHQLFALLCPECSGWGQYYPFVIDLRTGNVAPLGDKNDDYVMTIDDENPRIRDVDKEIFSR